MVVLQGVGPGPDARAVEEAEVADVVTGLSMWGGRRSPRGRLFVSGLVPVEGCATRSEGCNDDWPSPSRATLPDATSLDETPPARGDGAAAVAAVAAVAAGPGAPQWGELDAHTDEAMALDEVWLDGWSLTVAASSGTHSNS